MVFKTLNKKTIVTIMAIITAIVLVVAGVITWFAVGSNEKTREPTLAENDVSTPAFTFYNSKLMSLSAYTVAEQSDSRIMLTATILPVTTSDKAVDWTVEFSNPDSAWAQNKVATDYVTVEPTSDGALTAYVSAIKGFSEPVKIVAMSRVNENATAYCVADYGKRLADNITLTFENNSVSLSQAISSGGVQTVEAIRSINWKALMAMFSAPVDCAPAYRSEYTKDTTSEQVTISVRPVEEFYNSLKAQGLAKTSNTWANVVVGEACGKIYDGLCSVNVIPSNSLSDAYERINKFNQAILNTTADHDFDIKVTVMTDFETKEYLIPCQFNRAGAAFTATDLKLDQSNIVL